MSDVIRNYRDLKVWQMALVFTNEIYTITKKFPDEEKYGIISQLRRASVSVPSNIAEGCAKSSTKEFLRFIDIALGSVAEIDTQLEISYMQGYFNKDALIKLQSELKAIDSMLGGLKKSLRKKLEND